MTDAEQLALTDLYVCDICHGSRIEVDPETQQERRCRVCGGTGMLDYCPPEPNTNPFAGIESA